MRCDGYITFWDILRVHFDAFLDIELLICDLDIGMLLYNTIEDSLVVWDGEEAEDVLLGRWRFTHC
jgi:hypothetical protein